MKFITENDLRAMYKTQPFTTYTPNEGERLTPGARQFLIDRGVNIYTETPKPPTSSPSPTTPSGVPQAKKQWLCLKLDALRLQFLSATKEILTSDVQMAQQLTALARQLSLLTLSVEGKCDVADLYCVPCAGMNEETFSDALGDCVEVSEFCMQLEKAQTLLTMAQLRNAVRLFEVEMEMQLDDECMKKTLLAKSAQIVNRLSQLICQTMGGGVCQKKS